MENIKIQLSRLILAKKIMRLVQKKNSIMTGLTDTNYIMELEKLKNLSWLFSFPFDAFFETRYRIEEE